VAGGELATGEILKLNYQGQVRDVVPEISRSESPDAVMLVRRRLSRIFIGDDISTIRSSSNAATVMNMGLLETLRIGSVTLGAAGPSIAEASLEDSSSIDLATVYTGLFQGPITEKSGGSVAKRYLRMGALNASKDLVTKRIAARSRVSPRSATDTAQQRTETSLIEPSFIQNSSRPDVGRGPRQIALRGADITRTPHR